MELVYFTLWFMVTVALMWDVHRSHTTSQGILRDVAASTQRIEESAERIAQLTAEVLRRSN